jgi:hypothetical protein
MIKTIIVLTMAISYPIFVLIMGLRNNNEIIKNL